MPGRSMMRNVFDALTHLSRYLADSVLAVVIFDIRAACPIVSWERVWLVLRRFVVPEWLLTVLQALKFDSYSEVVFGGIVSDHGFSVKQGILQSCPASGNLWAILFNPVVRTLLVARVTDRVRGRFGRGVSQRHVGARPIA